MTPLARYQQDLISNGFSDDPAQAHAVQHLQALYEQLCQKQNQGWLAKIPRLFGKQPAPVKGLYFWGGVGRGKTYLMDTFYHCLPFDRKLRMHFHHFMRRVHKELTGLEGEKNPLNIVANRLADEARIICFDEFFVSDITDAMILGGLFEQLFKRNVTLVATSNVEPVNLYKDGLQRARFLPAIDLLNQHTQVINVDGGIDYRLRLLEKADTYYTYTPLNPDAHQQLERIFLDLIADHRQIRESAPLNIAGRQISSIKICEDIGWFSFAELCNSPRSQNDYIELASVFHTLFLENIPAMNAGNDDQCRRFINLIDEFYDRNVKLILSAETTPEQLYDGRNLSFEFKRTLSRLQEMQSREYLARPHKP